MVSAANTLAVSVNVAEVDPAGITIVPGMVIAWETLVPHDTVAPPAGAGPLRVKVPVAVAPPFIVDGEIASEISETGVTVRFADFVTPPKVAEIVTVRFAAWFVVAMLNVAVVAPAGTVTVAGTVAPAVDASVTTTPPVGATLASVTVPVTVFPPAIVVGLTETAERRGV